MNQLDLFTESMMMPRQLGTVGEDRAYSAAPDLWREVALEALESVCQSHTDFIVDAIWEAMPAVSVVPDRRAMAGVLSEGERRGWCVRTQELRRSEQRQCHGNRRQVWRSLLIT